MSFDEEYSTFKAKFLDQKQTKPLLEESTEVLRSKNEDWLSAFRIRLSQDLLTDDSSTSTVQLRTRGLFVLNTLFKALNTSLSETEWMQLMTKLIPHIVQHIDASNIKELTPVGKLVDGWKTLFPDVTIKDWTGIVEERKTALVPPTTAVPASAAPVAATSTATAAPTIKKRVFQDAFVQDGSANKETTTGSSAATAIVAPVATPAPFVPVPPVTVATHDTNDFLVLVLRSSVDPNHANATTVTIEQMQLLAIRICQFYLDRCKDPSEQIHWRNLLLSTLWLLHRHCADYHPGEDKIAIAFASVYLAGKIEHMFLKHQKIVEIANVVGPSILGANCKVSPSPTAVDNPSPSSTTEKPGLEFPDEDKLICYETELLQMINYDSNAIQNPIRPLTVLYESVHLLNDKEYYTAVKLLCKQDFLLIKEFWKFSENVIALVSAMIVKYHDDKSTDEEIINLFESALFEEIRDKESILNVLQLLSLIAAKAPSLLSSSDRSRMIVRLTEAFLQGNDMSASDVMDQSLLPESLRR